VLPYALQLSLDVVADAGFLCDKAGMLGESMQARLYSCMCAADFLSISGGWQTLESDKHI